MLLDDNDTGSTAVATTIDVRFYELDPYGHVNHTVYLNYFEVARIERLAAVGLGLAQLQQMGFHLLVVEAHVRFHAPAVLGDRLTVTSELTQLRRASARWHQRLTRGDELLAVNDVRSAITDTAGRPCAPPARFTDGLRTLGTHP